MSVVGELALWTALFLAAWASAVSFAGSATRRPELVESGARAIAACGAMIALACAGVWSALFGHDFALEYVAAHTTLNTPHAYLLTAFWAGPPGRLLWWATWLAICSAFAVTRGRRVDEAAPRMAGVVAAILVVSLVAVCFVWNPFDRAEWVPGEGRGLAPALQNVWAAPHLLMIYPAYALAALALVVAAVAARRGPDSAWRGALRGWSLAAWCVLTAAIGLGMRWGYTEPALGASWSWRAADAARMLLWLIGTALVRSFVVRGPRDASGAARPRVWGLYAVYAGVAVLLAGLAARPYWSDEVVRLQPGQAAQLRDPYRGGWRLVSQGTSRDEGINFLSTGVAVEAWRGGSSVGVVSAERRQYIDSAQRPVGEPTTKPGIRSFLTLDAYVLLTEVRGELAELRVSFRPLVACVWLGWALILAGAVAVAVRLGAARHTSAA